MDESTGMNPSVLLTSGGGASAASRAPERDAQWRGYVRRISAGDQSGLSALYDESSAIVYGLTLRILGSTADAEEVTIDVYTQVWRSAAAYQEGRGTVFSWLAMMARTRAIDRLRSRAPRSRAEQPLSAAVDIRAAGGTEMHAIRDLESQRIRAAFHILPEDQREAVSLAYLSGMTHSEIAQHLELPMGTVKTRIRLGMLKLRELLQGAA